MKPPAVSLARPDLHQWTYSAALAIRAARRYERSKFAHLPTPEETAAPDPAWERDVFRALEWMEFHRNAAKHPEMWTD